MKHTDLEKRLQSLREEAKGSLLKDVEFHQGLADRIVDKAVNDPSSMTRWKRPAVALMTIAAGVAVAALIGVATLKPQLLQNPVNHQVPATYSPVPPALVKDQFQHVTKIQLTVGRFPNDPRNTLTVKLSSQQQSELYQAMLKARLQHGQPLSAASMMYQITLYSKTASESGQYREDGAMMLPGDSNLQPPNTANNFASNPAVSTFMNQAFGPAFKKWFQQEGKKPSMGAVQAVTGFVDSLKTPTTAYRFCIPQLTFRRGGAFNFDSLQRESDKLTDPQYQIVDQKWGMGHNSLIARVKPAGQQQGTAFDVRADRLGDSWLVTAAGQTLTFTDSFDEPSMAMQQPFGKHNVVIIGTVKAPNIIRTKVRYVSPAAVTVNDLSKADIIVFERKGVQGPTHQQLPTKTAKGMVKGHADPTAVAQLQSSHGFQLALQQVKKQHATLVVVGNSDHLLNMWFMSQVLGIKLQGYSIPGGGSSSEIITYSQGQYQIADGASASQNGHQEPISPQLLKLVIQGAEFRLDTGESTGQMIASNN